MAASTLVGQNIGALKYERSKQVASSALKVIFAALTCAGALIFVFAEETLRVFVPEEPAVIAEGARFIRIISLTFGFIGYQQVASGALRGGGSPLVSLIIAITSLWVVRFPIAYILSNHTSLAQNGVYWSFVFSNIFGAFLAWVILRKDRWIKNITDPRLETEKNVLEEVMTEEGTSS